MHFNLNAEYHAVDIACGAEFFRAWKRRHGRRVKLNLCPQRSGGWKLTAAVPRQRLEYGPADVELSILVGDYRMEAFNDQPTEHAARRAARRGDGYDPELDPETVAAAAARLATVCPTMRAADQETKETHFFQPLDSRLPKAYSIPCGRGQRSPGRGNQ